MSKDRVMAKILVEDHPLVREARARFVAVQVEYAEADRVVSSRASGAPDESRAVDAFDRAAEAVAAGGIANLSAATAEAAAAGRADREAGARRNMLARAVEIARRGLKDAEAIASREICASLDAEHRELVLGVLRTAFALVASNLALRRLYDRLDEGGVFWVGMRRDGRLGPADFRLVLQCVHPGVDYHSQLGFWLRGLIEDGFVSRQEVLVAAPAEIRPIVEELLGDRGLGERC